MNASVLWTQIHVWSVWIRNGLLRVLVFNRFVELILFGFIKWDLEAGMVFSGKKSSFANTTYIYEQICNSAAQ